jgi:hypothetical protein
MEHIIVISYMTKAQEQEFLTKLSDLAASAALLSAAVRWGIEGQLDNREDLPSLSIRLQETIETTVALVESRRRNLRAIDF